MNIVELLKMHNKHLDFEFVFPFPDFDLITCVLSPDVDRLSPINEAWFPARSIHDQVQAGIDS